MPDTTPQLVGACGRLVWQEWWQCYNCPVSPHCTAPGPGLHTQLLGDLATLLPGTDRPTLTCQSLSPLLLLTFISFPWHFDCNMIFCMRMHAAGWQDWQTSCHHQSSVHLLPAFLRAGLDWAGLSWMLSPWSPVTWVSG